MCEFRTLDLFIRRSSGFAHPDFGSPPRLSSKTPHFLQHVESNKRCSHFVSKISVNCKTEEAGKNDDGSEKKEKKKRRLPRERLLRKIQANNEREQHIYEMRIKACRQPKKIRQLGLLIEKLPQKEPNLAEKIVEKKKMVEIRHQQLRSEVYNHIEDLEHKVDFLLQQLIGDSDSNEPYIDPEIWMMFRSEQFQQEIDTFLDCQIEDKYS